MVVRDIVGAHRLQIETGGYVSFEVETTNSLHRHDYFEICLVIDGRGEYLHGQTRYELKPGAVFLAQPGVAHEITSFATRNLRLYFVSVTLNSIDVPVSGMQDELLQAFSLDRQVVSYGHERIGLFLPLLGGGHFMDAELLKLFTLELVAALTPGAAVPGEFGQGELAQALAFIDRHLERRMSVEEIADHVGVSERTLRRRFQERLGCPVVDEINHRRMSRAAHRLLMGFGVRESGESVGVFDPSQFTRSFVRAFGIAPKQFQQTYVPGGLAGRESAPTLPLVSGSL